MDKGILFTDEMAKAADEGRKTQTRRLITERDCWQNGLSKKHHVMSLEHAFPVTTHEYIFVPYRHKDDEEIPWRDCGIWRVDPNFSVGQRLYLKETHYRYGKWVNDGKTKTGKQARRYIASTNPEEWLFEKPDFARPMDYTDYEEGWYLRSPLFMPKKFARKWFVVKDVRCERIQDISDEDVQAEGWPRAAELFPTINTGGKAKKWFRWLWDEIYGEGSWKRNSCVVKVTFEKIDH